MRRAAVAAASILLVACFSALVYYGIRHSRGIPVPIEEEKRVAMTVPFLDREIDLARGLSPDAWDSLLAGEVKLFYQLMVLPWGKSPLSPISVKAFHNGKDIHFMLAWRDETENRDDGLDTFSDAAAILFPIKDDIQPSTIMMGFLEGANIWQWKASQDREYWLGEPRPADAYSDWLYPFEESELFPVSLTIPRSAVNDLVAVRVGTITPKDEQHVRGRGIWEGGVWRVAFARSLAHADAGQDAVFTRGKKRLCAFAVWEGSRGDRGGRKSLSDWVEITLE